MQDFLWVTDFCKQVPRPKFFSLIICKCRTSVNVFITLESLIFVYGLGCGSRTLRFKGNSNRLQSKYRETFVTWLKQEGRNSSLTLVRWDLNPVHRCLAQVGQVVEATVAPLTHAGDELETSLGFWFIKQGADAEGANWPCGPLTAPQVVSGEAFKYHHDFNTAWRGWVNRSYAAQTLQWRLLTTSKLTNNKLLKETVFDRAEIVRFRWIWDIVPRQPLASTMLPVLCHEGKGK